MATNLREMPTDDQPPMQHKGRYYKVQIRGWVDFDPTARGLNDIVQAIETGNGVVTAVEVSQVANAINEINDPEVRERFTDIEAAKRVLENVAALPTSMKEKLQRALTGEPHVEELQSQVR